MIDPIHSADNFEEVYEEAEPEQNDPREPYNWTYND